jgi:hypothetical protein
MKEKLHRRVVSKGDGVWSRNTRPTVSKSFVFTDYLLTAYFERNAKQDHEKL